MILKISLFVSLHEAFAGFRIFCHPEVTAYHGVAGYGDAPQYRGIAIDDDVVLQDGVTCNALDGIRGGNSWLRA